MSFQRLITIIKKEFIHIKRDKVSLIIAVAMPLIFILIFGYAVNTDVGSIDIAVFDMDKTLESRDFINKFSNSNYFKIDIYLDDINLMEELIDKGSIKGALLIPSGFAKSLKRNERPKTQLIIDGTDPTIARTALQNGLLVTKMYSMKRFEEELNNKVSKGLSNIDIDLSTRVWYNPNLESTKFTIPALIGLIMQNITVMLTAFTLVREKEKGTIEQLIVTPIKSVELILGKMIPYIFIGFVDFLIALFFGTQWFDVPIEGSIFILILLGLGFVMCALAVGMLISTVSENQLQAMQMSLLFVLPSVLLSGFMFPREAMPLLIEMAGALIPLTYFINILRGIILKGIGIQYLWKDVIILLVFGCFLLTIASIRFKKKLD